MPIGRAIDFDTKVAANMRYLDGMSESAGRRVRTAVYVFRSRTKLVHNRLEVVIVAPTPDHAIAVLQSRQGSKASTRIKEREGHRGWWPKVEEKGQPRHLIVILVPFTEPTITRS
jgi:hypothetical protein